MALPKIQLYLYKGIRKKDDAKVDINDEIIYWYLTAHADSF